MLLCKGVDSPMTVAICFSIAAITGVVVRLLMWLLRHRGWNRGLTSLIGIVVFLAGTIAGYTLTANLFPNLFQ